MYKAVPVCLLVVIGLLLLCARPGVTVSAQSADPAAMGPLSVGLEEYNLENDMFMPPGFPFPVELRGMVRYPMNWEGGPLPLILFLHGNHATCFKTSGGVTSLNWPCQPGEEIIPNYQGFDYLAKVLASNGYIVASISANGINAKSSVPTDLGAQARAELVKKHLQLWSMFNAGSGQLGAKFKDKVDMQRIGLMGHSRGGEGMIQYFISNQSSSPYGIKAIFALAPHHQKDQTITINHVPLAVLLPYCDGDVKALDGVHFYDDSRYNLSAMNIQDTAPKHTILVLGANHNFFNTVWTPGQMPEYPGAEDDFSGTKSLTDPVCREIPAGRLTSYKQRTIGTAYVCAFMRAYVGGESQFLPLLTNQASPPSSVEPNKVHVSFHAPDNYLSRLDINRLSENNNTTTNTLGLMVTPSMLYPYELCGVPAQCLQNGSPNQEPHWVSTGNGLKQLKLGWSSNLGSLTNDISTTHRNISGYQALQFRASVNFDSMLNASSEAQNFKVVLKDGTGATAAVRAAQFSPALFYPPGTTGPLPKAVLNTVRVPLSAFTGVNLTDIRSVEFKFDQPDKGALLITDIALVSAAHILVPVFSSDVCLTDDSSGAELRFNTATGNYVFCYGGGLTMSGVGKVITHGSTVTMTQGGNEFDRRLVVTMDRSVKRGTASLQSPPGSLIVTITDRNTANNTCSCAPAP